MTITATTLTTSATEVARYDAALGFIVALVLLVLLVGKDISISAEEKRRIRWGSALDVAIAPLAITFLVIAATRVADILS